MAKNKYTIEYLPSFSEELNEIIYYVTFYYTLRNNIMEITHKIKLALKGNKKDIHFYL